MRITILFIIICTIFSCAEKQKKIILEKSLCLNNEDDAIGLAEKEWLKIYGEDIHKQRPFNVHIKNDSIWVIEGTLQNNYEGGTAYIEINSKDCKVLNIYHGK